MPSLGHILMAANKAIAPGDYEVFTSTGTWHNPGVTSVRSTDRGVVKFGV